MKSNARSWIIESITFIRASPAEVAHRFITTSEVWAICVETILGQGSTHAVKLQWNDAGEQYLVHSYVTQGEVVAFDRMDTEPYRARGKAMDEAWRVGWDRLWDALYNRQLSSYVEHPATGECRRISASYWVPANREPGLVKLADCTGAAGFDPSMIGAPIMLSEAEVRAWAAGCFARLAVEDETPSPTKSKRGGGMPLPEWYPILQTVVAAHYRLADSAAEKGKTLPFPTYRALAARISVDSKGRWQPPPDTVGKHAKKMRVG